MTDLTPITTQVQPKFNETRGKNKFQQKKTFNLSEGIFNKEIKERMENIDKEKLKKSLNCEPERMIFRFGVDEAKLYTGPLIIGEHEFKLSYL